MLVQAPPKEGDIVAMKLITGEEVVARLKQITDRVVSITKPTVVSLQMQQAAPNMPPQPIVVPMPWVLAVEDDAVLTIDLDKTIFVVKARAEMVSSYTQATSSIQVATGMNAARG